MLKINDKSAGFTAIVKDHMAVSVKYRALNTADDAEVATVAAIHEQAPRYWTAGYVPTRDQIQRRVEQLKTLNGCVDRYFQLAETPDRSIVGFHWIDLEKVGTETVAHIKSLWIRDDFQRKGIATALKKNGENWARGKAASYIKTTVHANNPRMLDFNRHFGFDQGFIEMTKQL